MPGSSRVPARFPVGTKYVLESHGKLVRRYLELPSGHRIRLASRKALTCKCSEQYKASAVSSRRSTMFKAQTSTRRSTDEIGIPLS